MPDEGPWRSIESLPVAPAAEPGRGAGLALPDDEETRKAVVAAYTHLARRGYTRRELGQKLARTIASADAIEAALDWLAARRLIDDRKLAEEAVRAGVERKGWGRRKMQQWLQGRGIDADTAADALGGIDPENETAHAEALAVRQRARGKRPEQVYRFLVSRGFPSAVARAAALRPDEDQAHPAR